MNFKKNDQVIFRGKVCTVFSVEPDGLTLDTGFAPVLYEHVTFDNVKMHKEYVAKATIDRELWTKQQAEADINTAKPIDELNVGDLIWTYQFGFKNCGDCIGTMVSDGAPYLRLARIEKIVDNLTIEDVDSESFGQGKGGSCSDCIDGVESYRWTDEQRKTFYSLVTLIKLKDGRHMFCDAQGYDYPRYIHVSGNWEEMFAPELEARRKEREEYERQQEEEFKADRAKQKADAEEYVATVLKDFKPAKMPKANVKRILSIIAPNINCEVTQVSGKWSGTTVRVKSAEEHIKPLKDAWNDMLSAISYQTGEYEYDWDDQLGSYEYETSECALDADFGSYVYFDAV